MKTLSPANTLNLLIFPLMLSLPLLLQCRSREPAAPPPIPLSITDKAPAPAIGSATLTIEDRTAMENPPSPLALILQLSLQKPARRPEVTGFSLQLPGSSRSHRWDQPQLEKAWKESDQEFRLRLPLERRDIPLGPLKGTITGRTAEGAELQPRTWQVRLTGRGLREGTLLTADSPDPPRTLNPPFNADITLQQDMMMVYFDTDDPEITHTRFRLLDSQGKLLRRSPFYKALQSEGTDSYLMTDMDFPGLSSFLAVKAVRIVPYSIREQGPLTIRYRVVSPAYPVNQN